MEILLLVIAVLCAIVGLVGAIVPVIPSSPLSFVGILLLFFLQGSSITLVELVGWGVLMLLLTAFDFVAPVWMAKKSGGTKAGTRGAMVGMLLGLFFQPWGLVFGPFLGALVGELIAGTPTQHAFRVAFYSFVGFLLTTGLKFVYGLAVLLYVIYYIVRLIFT